MLSKAGDTIKRFGFTARTALRGAFALGGLSAAADGLGKLLEGAVLNPMSAISKAAALAGEAIGRVPVVGGLLALPFDAAAAAAGLFADAIERSQEQLGALDRISKQTGASVADAQVFSFLAGSVGGMRQDLDAAGPLMVKFQKAIANAAVQGKEADNAFNRLGLNARELASGDLVGAFGQFAEKIKGLNNQAFAGQLAMRVFEEAGLRLLPTLLKGAEGIEEVRQKLGAFGLTVSGGAAQSLADLRKRATELRLLREGFFNQLSQAALPVLGALFEQLPRLTGGFKGLTDSIIEGFFKAADAFSFLVDVIQSGRLGDLLEAVAEQFKGAMLDAVAAVAAALPKLSDKGGDFLKSRAGGLLALLTPAGYLATGAATQQAARAGDAAGPLAAQAQAARDRAARVMEEIGKQIGTDTRDFVRDWHKRTLERLRNPGGAGGIDTLTPAMQRLFAEQEKFRPASERFRRQLDDLRAVLDVKILPPGANLEFLAGGPNQGGARVGDLAPGLGGRAAFALFQQLAQGAGRAAPTQSAAEAGSAEAARIITQFGEVGKLDIQQEIRRVLVETKALEERQAQVGEQVLQVQRQLAEQLKPKGM